MNTRTVRFISISATFDTFLRLKLRKDIPMEYSSIETSLITIRKLCGEITLPCRCSVCWWLIWSLIYKSMIYDYQFRAKKLTGYPTWVLHVFFPWEIQSRRETETLRNCGLMTDRIFVVPCSSNSVTSRAGRRIDRIRRLLVNRRPTFPFTTSSAR